MFTGEPRLPDLSKSPTTTFHEITNINDPTHSVANEPFKAYRRSDSLPSNNNQLRFSISPKVDKISSPSGVPPCVVRMLLDEKRRQIELNKSADVAQKFKLIGEASKEAFFKLQDSRASSSVDASPVGQKPRTSLTAKMRERQAATADRSSAPPQSPSAPPMSGDRLADVDVVDQRSSAPPAADTGRCGGDVNASVSGLTPPQAASNVVDAARAQVSGGGVVGGGDAAVPVGAPRSNNDFLAINESLRELKEQMKRLSVGHELLQAKVIGHRASSDEPVTIDHHLNRDFMLTPNKPVPAPRRPVTPEVTSFHLHTTAEPPSRLDPSLELSRNLSSWGMTYRTNQRTPRKTWDNASCNKAQSSALNLTILEPSMADQQGFRLFNSSGGMKDLQSPTGRAERRPTSSPGYICEPTQAQANLISGAVLNDASPIPTTCEFLTPLGGRRLSDAAKFSPAIKVDGKGASISYDLGEVAAADKRIEDSMDERKKRFIAASLKRKAEQEARRLKIEQENLAKQELVVKKQCEEEKRKKEKELRRLKAFEEYQRRKVEQEQSEFVSRNNLHQSGGGASNAAVGRSRFGESESIATASRPPSATPTFAPTMRNLRVRSQPATNRQRAARPASQYVNGTSRVPVFKAAGGRGSADNLDLVDGKSQSSDGASGSGCSMEPTLKVFVKPIQKSNRNLIFNAVRDRVLVGAANTEKKNKVLEELARSDGKHFLILFRDQKFQFRGVYSWDQASDNVHKLCGLGPKTCHESFMNMLFKYDSGAKLFNEIPARHLSASIDAFTIKDEYWQEKRIPYGRSSTMNVK